MHRPDSARGARCFSSGDLSDDYGRVAARPSRIMIEKRRSGVTFRSAVGVLDLIGGCKLLSATFGGRYGFLGGEQFLDRFKEIVEDEGFADGAVCADSEGHVEIADVSAHASS